MALTQKALEAINKPTIRIKIAEALGVGEMAVIHAIKLNRDVLTKYAALQVIKAETGLAEDEILTQVTA